MNTGEHILIQVAVDGGAVWKRGVITASYPKQFKRRGYDVTCADGHRIENADPISMRELPAKVAA